MAPVKRALCTALALFSLLSALSGCGKAKTYELPWDQFCCPTGGQRAELKLRAAEKEAIVDLLNDGDWTDAGPDCSFDYVFYTRRQTVRYHSESGTFYDETDRQYLTVTEAQRLEINAYLARN